ncbi:hypothetical protein QPF19_004353 [Salmonella enterica]|nr:hypothetical protein [Salmonella enterica subsp. enterica serovar Hvittingfoss]ELT8232552.1 hypothetical protein [Salmonella enterica]
MKSLSFGLAFSLTGLMLIVITGYGDVQSADILPQALNAIFDNSNPFHHVAQVGVVMLLAGMALLFYWIFFSGSAKNSKK